ncbi:methylated-DNA--[protein]-cysteine S-methyltransferase [Herbiconiux sp. KACC 21604]|uniref:methylated-DNA--[protein]-cysteine S-methyltransferase n=1 Tax=unclassified Herbiconiux TaxID=2618217 RepID=UPI001490B649|nr:methylated-DNA--[protein]-cysteine S-methyltransferase [Herbiconiux sp. SALV-R1]QJU53207.1 methylated-DNA--[protein]-cysteine S-methyltransferase [Herbiconiux sp. SALV-R1]WPO88157.1 methylated-DNA--[protein]-cysteine S-methyltransferase [Herbiconiux sp. KACC 21604]
MTAVIQFLDTPDGAFGIIADDEGRVLASGWTGDPAALLARITPVLRPASVEPGEVGAAAEAALAYYDGEVTAIDGVRVLQSGGVFHQMGWDALRTIPAGSPLSYQQFAAALGRPSAVRAAASACARNAPALFVPCHRVLRTDGSLGGFAWGTPVKQSLLARESRAAR